MTTIPTLRELYNSILADLQAEMDVNIPSWGVNFLRALAAVQAGKLKIYYLAFGMIQRNIFVDAADPEASGGTLERFGRVKLGRNPFPASQGQYQVTVTGLFGGIIPPGTTFRSDDNAKNKGALFILDNEYTLAGTSGSIIIRALKSGVSSRLNHNDTLTATAPIINVDGGVKVVGEIIIPNDPESIEDYRQKAIERFRLRPQGGASSDIRIWGKDAAGVKQIYPYTASSFAGQINVFVEATQTDSADGKGTPTTTILNAVRAVLEADPITSLGRRPMGVFNMNVQPVTVNKLYIEIVGFQNLTSQKEALILQGLTQAINNVRPFIAGADNVASKNDTLSQNNVINVILSTLPGSIFTEVNLTLQIGSGPVSEFVSQVFINGNIPFLESVTYA